MSTFATAVLPSPEEEIWRYSRIDELDLAGFEPEPTTATVDGWGVVDVAAEPDEAPVDVFAELNRRHGRAGRHPDPGRHRAGRPDRGRLVGPR